MDEIREYELRIVDCTIALVASGYAPARRAILERLLQEYTAVIQRWADRMAAA